MWGKYKDLDRKKALPFQGEDYVWEKEKRLESGRGPEKTGTVYDQNIEKFGKIF